MKKACLFLNAISRKECDTVSTLGEEVGEEERVKGNIKAITGKQSVILKLLED